MNKKETGERKTGPQESQPEREPEPKKTVEQRLDDIAEKFSRAMSEGVKRIESAFERGKENIREGQAAQAGWKGFITSPSGGVLLIIIGIIWLFYTVGLLKNPIFPTILVIVGFYFVLRRRG